MSINKELKFTKWYEENVVGKYEDAPCNYFMDDVWFNSLPKNLKKSIIKVNEKTYDDLLYDTYLEELEVEIKTFTIIEYKSNYDVEDIRYLLECLDYYEFNYNEYHEKKEV